MEIVGALRHWSATIDWSEAGRNLVAALAIIAASKVIADLLNAGVTRLRGRFGQARSFLYVVGRIGSYVILLIGFAAALATLGIDIASLSIFGGAVGVGLGLGLQGVVKEFVSGLALIFDPSIQIGDFVELEGGFRGELVAIGPRASRLRTNDGMNVIIPNSTLFQSRVTNWTYNDSSPRLRIPFSTAEESDLARVREVVLAAARKLPFTRPEDSRHKTQVWLVGFAADGLDFELVVWPKAESARHPSTVRAAYTWSIREALRAAEIGDADPRLDVTLQQAPAPRRRGARSATDAAAAAQNDAVHAVFEEAARLRDDRNEEPRRLASTEGPVSGTPGARRARDR